MKDRKLINVVNILVIVLVPIAFFLIFSFIRRSILQSMDNSELDFYLTKIFEDQMLTVVQYCCWGAFIYYIVSLRFTKLDCVFLLIPIVYSALIVLLYTKTPVVWRYIENISLPVLIGMIYILKLIMSIVTLTKNRKLKTFQ